MNTIKKLDEFLNEKEEISTYFMNNFKKLLDEHEIENFDDITEEKKKELKEKQDEYEKFFREKLKKWDINSPADLSDEDKKKFFDEIDKEWKK